MIIINMPKRIARRGSARAARSSVKSSRQSSRLRGGGKLKPVKVLPDALELSFSVYEVPYQNSDYTCPEPFRRIPNEFAIKYETTDDEDVELKTTTLDTPQKTIDKRNDANRRQVNYASYRADQSLRGTRDYYSPYVYCEYSPSGKYKKKSTDFQKYHHIKFNKTDAKFDCSKYYNDKETPEIFQNKKVRKLCGMPK